MAKKQYRRYGSELKKQCLLRYAAGASIPEISSDLDVPTANLYTWRRNGKWDEMELDQSANILGGLITGPLSGMKVTGVELIRQLAAQFQNNSFEDAANTTEIIKAIAVVLGSKLNTGMQDEVIYGSKASTSDTKGNDSQMQHELESIVAKAALGTPE